MGDGNKMCHSYIHAAQLLDFDLRIACPDGYAPDPYIVRAAGTRVTLSLDPMAAARGAELVVTDVGASMGQEEEEQARRLAVAPYQVTAAIMAAARSDALFMHCLPAHPGEQMCKDVLV